MNSGKKYVEKIENTIVKGNSDDPIIKTEKDNPNIDPQAVQIINFSLEQLEEIKRIHELKLHSAMIKTKHHKSGKEDHSKFRKIEYKDIPNYKRSLLFKLELFLICLQKQRKKKLKNFSTHIYLH